MHVMGQNQSGPVITCWLNLTLSLLYWLRAGASARAGTSLSSCAAGDDKYSQRASCHENGGLRRCSCPL